MARSSPAISRQSLRSLRLQVSVALALAAAACAFIASKSSSDELHGAYRDSARDILRTASGAFKRDHDPAALDLPVVLRNELRALIADHPELASASVYRARDASMVVSAGERAGGPAESGMALEAMNSRDDA